MNSAERVFTALRGETPDRVPILEWFVHEKVYQGIYPGCTWPDFVEKIDLDAITVHPGNAVGDEVPLEAFILATGDDSSFRDVAHEVQMQIHWNSSLSYREHISVIFRVDRDIARASDQRLGRSNPSE